MHRIFKVIVVTLSAATVAYTLSPLLGFSQHQLMQSGNADGSSSAPNAVTGVVFQATRMVVTALHMNDGCRGALRYAIDAVDPRFGISQDVLQADLKQAELIWENTSGEDVLQYDPQADFKVNLVFDERQKQTIASNALKQKLDTVQTLHKGISQEYDTLSSQYEEQKSHYESDVAKYKQLVDTYEKQVASWNAKGGAPKDEYQQLKEQRKEIESLADEIEKKRKNINDIVARLNALAGKEKQVVSGYNKEVSTYEDAYGGEKEFDQGVYTGKAIDIYQFSTENELILVLAHELGHALGMDHVQNPQSIMYYLMAKQNADHPVPTAEDRQALLGRCQ